MKRYAELRCFSIIFVVAVVLCMSAYRMSFADPPVGSRAGEPWDDNGLGMKFCWCPPGAFTMGVPNRPWEPEPVQVELTQGFWLAKYEVTQAVWLSVMGKYRWKYFRGQKLGGAYAIPFATWWEADEFCRKLTADERAAGQLSDEWAYDLPTEAQWEYACRAGTRGDFSFDEKFADVGDYAWYMTNAELRGENYPHLVGTRLPNPWGLHDMHGNVAEWCRDVYRKTLPGGTDPFNSPADPIKGPVGLDTCVVRGGDWKSGDPGLRSAARTSRNAGEHANDMSGFRVALVRKRK